MIALGSRRPTRRSVEARLGDRLVIWVDPRKVSFCVGTKWPVTGSLRARIKALPSVPVLSKASLRALEFFEPFVIPERSYREPWPIEQEARFRRVLDFLRNRADPQASAWYRQLVAQLRDVGVAEHKGFELHSESEIDAFLRNYLSGVVDSLASEGYRLDKDGEIGTALVGRDGTLHKSGSASHRFYIARLLGVVPLPLKIAGVHAAFWSPADSGLLELVERVERNHQ